mgnify:CR=1 FL=1
MGSSSSKVEISEDGTRKKNIKKIKRIPPDADFVRPEKEDRNTKKLREINENDDYDIDHPEYHEYMFFSVKNGEEKKNNNLELLKKSIKKKKKQNPIWIGATVKENTSLMLTINQLQDHIAIIVATHMDIQWEEHMMAAA